MRRNMFFDDSNEGWYIFLAGFEVIIEVFDWDCVIRTFQDWEKDWDEEVVLAHIEPLLGQ